MTNKEHSKSSHKETQKDEKLDASLINFNEIETKWQKAWEDHKIFEVIEDKNKKKFYVLEMFAYPSGTGLHMGHAYNFSIGDIFARFKIMQGFNVLHPVGYDSLGLPAENAAIKVGTHPEEYTKKSIQNFIKQQKMLGLSYDWTRLINTSDSEYYKWDQWIFIKMLEKGLAYQKEASVNWCPKCQTVLANEQAQDGNCTLCGTQVQIKHLKQWFLKISDYSERLLKGHEKLNWPQKTIAMQKNWIGKSEGTQIDFKINKETWPIFTTRPDTIFGVTFMVVSAQHPKLMELVTKEQKKEVESFLKKLKSVSEKESEIMEKEGVFTGSFAINPANGEKVPVWAGNFVVADYGAGMVMAVPAHDQRDFEFAKKYKINIKQVIYGEITPTRAYTLRGLLVNSKEFNGIESESAKSKISQWLIDKKSARKVINYKLRDWCLSRQRYWGTPIPVVHCNKCGVVPVNEKDLPIELPKNVKFGKGNPLITNESWLNTKCPNCLGKAKRETDTMDTFVNSSWYFLRYCDPKNDKEIFSKEKVNYWMPVDVYIGGVEHACMHLIYHRFYSMFLHELGLINFNEPTPRLFHQGMINDSNGEKMSKSKGNVVEPIETVKKYGVDTTRFFMISEASPDKGFNWSEEGIQGSLRFINKVHRILDALKFGKDSLEFSRKLNNHIKNITSQIETFDYRKSTLELRELFDLIISEKEISKESLGKALKLLSPFCPHVAEEMWQRIENKGFISLAQWPKVDEKIKSQDSKEDFNEKISKEVLKIIANSKEKGKEINHVYLYIIPNELPRYDAEVIEKKLGKKVKIFAVNDKTKYDPQGKASKTNPGKPGIFVE